MRQVRSLGIVSSYRFVHAAEHFYWFICTFSVHLPQSFTHFTYGWTSESDLRPQMLFISHSISLYQRNAANVSSGHVKLTNTHGMFRAERCQICHHSGIYNNSQHRRKFPNEWRDPENTWPLRLRMIDVCQITFVCNCDHLDVFQGVPGPVGNKGPKGRQVNSLYKH